MKTIKFKNKKNEVMNKLIVKDIWKYKFVIYL